MSCVIKYSTQAGKKGNYWQPVSQYTVEGDFIASFEKYLCRQ
ncbi:hypothetical protein [Chryseobacterium wanjuense]